MASGKTRFRLAGILVLFLVFLTGGYRAQGVQDESLFSVQKRADLIQIDTLKQYRNLERPAVSFLHDKHTDALGKKGKDCNTCHLSEEDRLVPLFQRMKDAGRGVVMDIYHTGCIECHTKTLTQNEKSGPIICAECHQKTTRVIFARQPMGFDYSLHVRHSEAYQKKCEQCHHAYDARTQKLFYAKEKEGTCRYCHKKTDEENRISMRKASHLSCIECHSKNMEKNENAGPVKCNGCHDQKLREMIEKLDSIPRMTRKQPDIVFVKTGLETKDVKDPTTRMDPVPFNHKAHESYNDTCRVCHHEGLNACSECHTLAGSKAGKGVRLDQAMHRMGTNKSCMGCHEVNQRDEKCSGCHASLQPGRKQQEASCVQCHMTSPPEGITASLQNKGKPVAAALLASRKPTDIFVVEDIPETVVIKMLMDKYEPVELPHRKIVLTLTKNIKENRLAKFFHDKKGTICQGCHHHSPLSKTPPGCASCHGEPFDKADLFKPGLMGAYHRQCMGCHAEMGVQKPDTRDCTGCHIEKKEW